MSLEQKALELLMDSGKLLLNSLEKNDHPLARCTVEIQELIRRGSECASKSDWDGALKHFQSAADKDPKYVGAQTRLVKVHRAMGSKSKALFIAGRAFDLSKDKKIRCQLLDLCGQISADIFRISPTENHAWDAIDFYKDAVFEDAEDPLPRWNLTLMYLRAAQGLADLDDQKRADMITSAKDQYSEIVSYCRAGKLHSNEYLPSIASDARAQTPSFAIIKDDDWWGQRTSELSRLIDEKGWDVGKAPAAPSEIAIGRRTVVKGALLAASIAIVIAAGGYAADAFDLDTVRGTIEHVQQPAGAGDTGSTLSKVGVIQLESASSGVKFSEVERDWKDFAEVSRDWEKLA